MRGEYNTRQKREMFAFLKNHHMQHYSVDDLVFELQQQGEKIGRTTAYRYLELLAEQGNVRKYLNAQGVTQYQHVGDDCGGSAHFHMMCKSCGQLMHVNCELMQSMAEHIQKDHGFTLDPMETILVGTCARCSRQNKGDEHDGADYAGECHHCV